MLLRTALVLFAALSLAPLSLTRAATPIAPELAPGWAERLPPHPRLVLTPARLATLQQRLDDPLQKAWLLRLRAEAEAALELPPAQRVLKGRRMLDASRETLRRLLIWSLIYRLGGDARFLEAAGRDLDAVADFTDWNPSHYLDTAEMAAGVALAYDWLHADLSPERRARVVAALRRHALRTFPAYAERLAAMSHNWNSVCHGGLSLAALAIANEAPDEAAAVLRAAVPAVAAIRSTYAPEGVFTEGPAYWDYGTSYLCLFADALETTLGHTHGLERIEGVLPSVRYMEHITSPTEMTFNFADCREEPRALNFATAWLAARQDERFILGRYAERARLSLAAGDRSRLGDVARFEALAFLFAALHPAPADKVSPPATAWAGRGPVPIAAMRSSWTAPDAAFLAIKGGSASFSHAHMDVGAFVYDWAGQRWFRDLDRQDYHSLESKGFTQLFDLSPGSKRWEVFRVGSEGHNILRFNQSRQDTRGVARKVEFSATPVPTATLDLTPAYASRASSVTRRVSLLPDGRATIEDRWSLLPEFADAETAWQFVTGARVEPQADGVRLQIGERSVRVRVLEPTEIRIVVADANTLLQPHDAPLPGIVRVQFLTRSAQGMRVQIEPIR